MIARAAVLAFGVLAFAAGVASFFYFIGFAGGWFAGASIDAGVRGTAWEAWAFDLGLLVLFGAQHSLMARAWWKRRISGSIARSTYVLATAVVLGAICRYWRPLPDWVWDLRGTVAAPVLTGGSLAGWALVFWAAIAIGHWDLFGLAQVRAFAAGQEYRPLAFRSPGPYRAVRHPMMLGVLAGLWLAPAMSEGRLLLAMFLTAYVLIALRWEEHDLEVEHGERYRDYRRRVPRLAPWSG